MKLRLALPGCLLVVGVAGACSGGTAPSGSSTTASVTAAPASAAGSNTQVPTTPQLAGAADAKTRAALGYRAGYQETATETSGHQLLHRNQPSLDIPGTQVHCPAVAVTIGATFVCVVDTSPTTSVDEPLKVDGLDPLNLEFAVIDRATFQCAGHATWVLKAMSDAGSPCPSGPSTTAHQGQGQGQGQGSTGPTTTKPGQGQGQAMP